MIGYIPQMCKQNFMDDHEQVDLLMFLVRKNCIILKKIFKMQIGEWNN